MMSDFALALAALVLLVGCEQGPANQVVVADYQRGVLVSCMETRFELTRELTRERSRRPASRGMLRSTV